MVTRRVEPSSRNERARLEAGFVVVEVVDDLVNEFRRETGDAAASAVGLAEAHGASGGYWHDCRRSGDVSLLSPSSNDLYTPPFPSSSFRKLWIPVFVQGEFSAFRIQLY